MFENVKIFEMCFGVFGVFCIIIVIFNLVFVFCVFFCIYEHILKIFCNIFRHCLKSCPRSVNKNRTKYFVVICCDFGGPKWSTPAPPILSVNAKVPFRRKIWKNTFFVICVIIIKKKLKMV